MNIVSGSGNNRKVLEFPCSYFVKKSPVEQQIAGRDLICDLLNISKEAVS